MTVTDFARKNSLKVLTMPEPEREIVGGYAGDLLSWVMGRAKSGDAWITIMSNINIVAVASLSDVSCIILSEGVIPEQQVLNTASEKGINILSTEADTFTVSATVKNSLL